MLFYPTEFKRLLCDVSSNAEARDNFLMEILANVSTTLYLQNSVHVNLTCFLKLYWNHIGDPEKSKDIIKIPIDS